MNAFTLSCAYIRERLGNSMLNALVLALGVATIVVLLQLGHHAGQRLQRDASGVDLVVGAKGSPLQLILSSLYHIDVPTGNIAMEDAERVMHDPMVRQAIPLALGDSWHGFRIVGTTPDYMHHYDAKITDGVQWDEPFEAVIGADVAARGGLGVGDSFMSAHGLMVNAGAGHVHKESPYTVVGVMARSGTVLDRLALTSVDSVLMIHGLHWHDHDDHDYDYDHEHGHDGHADDADHENHANEEHEHEHGDEAEITALLVSYATKSAALTLPRRINADTSLQAASPAYETARLMSMLGVGIDVLRGASIFLILVAAAGIFVNISNALNVRLYDLAVMRALGAHRGSVFRIVMFEGLLLTTAGAVIGIVLGHCALSAAVSYWPALSQSGFDAWRYLPAEAALFGFCVLVGLVAALFPALRIYRMHVSRILSERGV